MSEAQTKMWTLQEEFSHFEIGRSSQFRNLTLFPLVRRNTPTGPLDYLLLEDGITQGKVRVRELHGGASVPELRLENTADVPVLLVDGEELVGAKQNRVLNLTILAPAHRTTMIPVSCEWDTQIGSGSSVERHRCESRTPQGIVPNWGDVRYLREPCKFTRGVRSGI